MKIESPDLAVLACEQLAVVDLQTITTSVIEGVTVALVWAALVWTYEQFRTRLIRRSIILALDKARGVIWRPPGELGVILKNKSGWTVTIRNVRFVLRSEAPFEVIEARYLGSKTSEYDGHVTLKPNTEDAWGIPEKMLTATIKRIEIEFEFQSTLGRTIVVSSELSAKALNSFLMARRSAELKN
jgi:hypothetical protein